MSEDDLVNVSYYLQSMQRQKSDQVVQIDEIEEAQAFVSKVHMAAVEMQKAMSTELKVLGVPFFGTKPECVSRNGRNEPDQLSKKSSTTPKITEDELLVLQRKMSQYLEDLYG